MQTETNILQNNMGSSFIFKHEVDKSVLTEGFSIPVRFQTQFLADLNIALGGQGATKNITMIIEGDEFTAKLKNQKFDTNIHSTHCPVIQIRYSSDLAKRLRAIFINSWIYISEQRALAGNGEAGKTIHVPEEMREYIVLYATPFQNVIRVECITSNEMQEESQEIKNSTEESLELFSNTADPTATIETAVKTVKIRRLDHSICDTLKELYGYRCQITGEKVGSKYSALVVEAHHIDYFTKSLNNNTDNIIIVNPTFHRIIHKENPIFDRKKLEFVFANGVHEKVTLNMHL